MAQLPEELLQHIFSHLQPLLTSYSGDADLVPSVQENYVRYRTLVSICSASKTCYRMAIPYLYRSIDLEACGPIATHRILRSFLMNSSLAKEVQELRIGYWIHTNRKNKRGRTFDRLPKDRDVLACIDLEALAPLSVDFRYKIQDGLNRWQEDSELAVLLALCKNLQSFLFVLPLPVPVWSPSYALEIIGGPGSRLSPLPLPFLQLREVTMIPHSQGRGFMPLTEARMFRQPALQIFRGARIIYGGVHATSTPVRSKTLKTAIFTDSPIEAEGIEELLKGCPQLETLSLDLRCIHGGICTCQYGRLGEALRDFGGGLIDLRLSCKTGSLCSLEGTQPLGHLRSLKSLRLLTVSERMLFGTEDETVEAPKHYIADSIEDLLPVQLENFTITGRNNEYRDDFDHAMSDLMRSLRFDRLSLITFNQQFSHPTIPTGWSSGSSGQGKDWITLRRKADHGCVEAS